MSLFETLEYTAEDLQLEGNLATIEVEKGPHFIVDKGIEEVLPKLTGEEAKTLEKNIIDEGCLQPLTIWQEENKLIDGYNRYRICKKHDIPFKVIYKSFANQIEVEQWMVDNQIGRRNMNAEWVKYLLGDEWEEDRKKIKAFKQKKRLGIPVADAEKPEHETIGEMTTALAKRNNINELTLRQAPEYKKAVDIVAANLGFNRAKILDGKMMKITQQEVRELATFDPPTQRKFVAKLESGAAKNLRDAKKQERQETAQTIETTPEVEDETVVELGQWWKLGRHYLYCGDTSEEAFIDVLPQAAFAFADPPYNVQAAKWDSEFEWKHSYVAKKADIAAITPGHRPMADFLGRNFISDDPMRYRWQVACWITNGMTRGDMGFGNWIHVLLFGEGKIYRDSQDFLRVTINNAETEETSHRGRKPSELLIWLIQTFTQENDLVLDPFLGSGTTLLAAEKTNRKCIGGELEPIHCVEIIRRWEALSGEKAELAMELDF